MIEVKIEGTEELNAKFKQAFEKDLKATERAVYLATLKAEAEAKKICPVDTGRLRSSITHKVEGLLGEVGTNVHYAPYVEFGTRKMKAQPYLKPGGEEGVEYLKKKIEEILKK